MPQALATPLSMPGGNVSDPVVRQVDIARPAVVRIITRIDGQLTVRFTSSSPTVTFPLDGSSYLIELSGSGAFVGAHGDILTADHVVNPPHDQGLDDALYQIAAQDIADYVNAHFRVTKPLNAGDVVASLESGVFQPNPEYGQTGSRVYLSTAFTGPVNVTRFAEIPASAYAAVDRIEAQSSFDAMDVAIIHVSGMDDMPGIQLGDSRQVAEQDNLTIIGYPGLGDVSDAPTNLLTSSINRVYVSAMKTTDTGAPVIQVGGNVEHGDSGAPALDNSGRIVGVVSFGLLNPNENGETSFLQASNSAISLIQSQSINTTPGPFQRAWRQAFDDYASTTAGHWHRAARELRSLANTYRGFLAITAYLTYAQSQAGGEQVSAVAAPANSTAILVTVLALLALIVGVGLLFRVMRQRTQPARAVRSGPVPMGGYALWQDRGPALLPGSENYFSPPVTRPLTEKSAADAHPGFLVEHLSLPEGSASPFLPLADTPLPEQEHWSHVREEEHRLPIWPAPLSPSDKDLSSVEDPALGDEVRSQHAETMAPALLPEARGLALPEWPGAGGVDPLLETQEKVALCGHANLANGRFCRVCGRPLTFVESSENNNEVV
ncbi:MAG TPA: serine protease [Ktedonobacteraceae bacterium]